MEQTQIAYDPFTGQWLAGGHEFPHYNAAWDFLHPQEKAV